MSTRCSAIVKKDGQKVYAYCHWDGYPDGAGRDLKNFMDGHAESIDSWPLENFGDNLEDETSFEFENACVHGDENYVYVVDMDDRTLKGYAVPPFKCASDNVDEFELVFDEKF
jgi:hypothetical protein